MGQGDAVWNVLVVDDEPDMLQVTRMALDGFVFQDRAVLIHTAQTAGECLRLLDEIPDLAVAFLDVVMEEEDTGFKLIRHIREECKNSIMRLIIFTGQPGKAPLMEVVQRYDINDYKEKTELTTEKLRLALITALRSWIQLREIEANRSVLQHLVEKSPILFRARSVNQFANTVLDQLAPLMCISDPNAAQDTLFALDMNGRDLDVQAGTGRFGGLVDHEGNMCGTLPSGLQEEMLQTERFHYHDDGFTMQVASSLGVRALLHVRGTPVIDDWNSKMLQVFMGNVAAAFDNLLLKRDAEATHREVVLNLGELLEARSCETGYHVHRVAAISRLLAERWGTDLGDLEMIGLAAAFHDIGKILMPDQILNKPGPLTPAEFEVIKQHTLMGQQILERSSRPLFRIAAIMAGQHHERYDGTGYPAGLIGKGIHRYGRILALSDVYDALSHDSVYKLAWPEEEVLAYIKSQKGKHFDPVLVDLFFNLYDEIHDIMLPEWNQKGASMP